MPRACARLHLLSQGSFRPARLQPLLDKKELAAPRSLRVVFFHSPKAPKKIRASPSPPLLSILLFLSPGNRVPGCRAQPPRHRHLRVFHPRRRRIPHACHRSASTARADGAPVCLAVSRCCNPWPRCYASGRPLYLPPLDGAAVGSTSSLLAFSNQGTLPLSLIWFGLSLIPPTGWTTHSR